VLGELGLGLADELGLPVELGLPFGLAELVGLTLAVGVELLSGLAASFIGLELKAWLVGAFAGALASGAAAAARWTWAAEPQTGCRDA